MFVRPLVRLVLWLRVGIASECRAGSRKEGVNAGIQLISRKVRCVAFNGVVPHSRAQCMVAISNSRIRSDETRQIVTLTDLGTELYDPN